MYQPTTGDNRTSCFSAFPGFSAELVFFPSDTYHNSDTPVCPVYQAVLGAPPLQPVPVPSLPKLIIDSKRDFIDLKMALNNLLNPLLDLTEHYKYRVLMEQLVFDEAKLIA